MHGLHVYTWFGHFLILFIDQTGPQHPEPSGGANVLTCLTLIFMDEGMRYHSQKIR